MSGGPVFTADGSLVGIVSTSFDLRDGEAPIATFSSLWPALALPPHGDPARRLIDYVVDGTIPSRDPERFADAIDKIRRHSAT
jgi:hypothetical protein